MHLQVFLEMALMSQTQSTTSTEKASEGLQQGAAKEGTADMRWSHSLSSSSLIAAVLWTFSEQGG